MDRDRHRGGVRAAVAVAEGVGEAVGGRVRRAERLELPVRIVREAAVLVDRHESALGADGVGAADGQDRPAVGIAVVGQHARCGDRQGRILVGRGGVVLGHRRVVLAGDLHGHGGRIRPAVAVADGVLERIVGHLAGEEVLELPVRVVREPAVFVDRDQGALGADGVGVADGQRIAVHVGIVAQHAGGIDRRGRVLAGAVLVVRSHRIVVDRRDRDRHRADVGVDLAVVGGEGEAVRPVVVGVRLIGESPGVGVEGRQRAVLGRVLDLVGQRIGGVGVGGGDGSAVAAVFGHVERTVVGNRRLVEPQNADRLGLDDLVEVVSVNAVGETDATAADGDREGHESCRGRLSSEVQYTELLEKAETDGHSRPGLGNTAATELVDEAGILIQRAVSVQREARRDEQRSRVCRIERALVPARCVDRAVGAQGHACGEVVALAPHAPDPVVPARGEEFQNVDV